MLNIQKKRVLTAITIPSLSTRRKIISHFYSFNIQRTTTYDVGNPGFCLGQAHKCGGIKPINGLPSLIHLRFY